MPPSTFANGTQASSSLFVGETINPIVAFESLFTHVIFPIILVSSSLAAFYRWRFQCASIAQLDEIVAAILSLIRVEGTHHVDFDLLDVLPDMGDIRRNLECLLDELSALKQETYEREPDYTRLVAWLIFRRHQIRKIDRLHWAFRRVQMQILIGIEKERRTRRNSILAQVYNLPSAH
ncbi:hypothetical protein VNI00_019056 [Paramarasmius palmivorus]|uniref:Uncharacterized protein n=1 Tax=Paramarasmius palmivorus TaxID=297713 RepID=A0AAW0ASB6_9AGAR